MVAKISVCMASYNGENYIQEQLISILNQLSSNDEVIISDDSSTDQTIAKIKLLNDDRIILLENNTFHSPTYNFENALKHASGDFIFLSDQDDVWLDGKITKSLSALDHFDLVVSDCKVVDKKLNIIKESFVGEKTRQKGFIRNLYSNPYMGCCMAFKKEVLRYVLPIPNGIILHDIWIGLSVELHGKIHFVDDKLILFRRHGSNASQSGEVSRRPLYSKLSYRLVIMWALILRCFLQSKRKDN